MTTECQVFRCARQAEMYLYLRAGLVPDALPAELRRRTGALTQVMTLQLTPERKLARADSARVLASLASTGWYLQLPSQVDAHLHFGD